MTLDYGLANNDVIKLQEAIEPGIERGKWLVNNSEHLRLSHEMDRDDTYANTLGWRYYQFYFDAVGPDLHQEAEKKLRRHVAFRIKNPEYPV